jgi:hypothetical protein
MNAEEQQHYNYMAATRLSEIGYRRYLNFMRKCCQTKPANEIRGLIKDFIDKLEARELTLAMLVRCAPVYKPLQ